ESSGERAEVAHPLAPPEEEPIHVVAQPAEQGEGAPAEEAAERVALPALAARESAARLPLLLLLAPRRCRTRGRAHRDCGLRAALFGARRRWAPASGRRDAASRPGLRPGGAALSRRFHAPRIVLCHVVDSLSWCGGTAAAPFRCAPFRSRGSKHQ